MFEIIHDGGEGGYFPEEGQADDLEPTQGGSYIQMFNMLMVATEKKLKLIEKKVEIVAASKDAKMLTLKIEDLDDDARVIVQAVCFEMLKRQ